MNVQCKTGPNTREKELPLSPNISYGARLQLEKFDLIRFNLIHKQKRSNANGKVG